MSGRVAARMCAKQTERNNSASNMHYDSSNCKGRDYSCG